MKKVLTPASQEEAVYYSDFSGECFSDNPDVTVVFDFAGHSNFRNQQLELHLTDLEFKDLILSKLTTSNSVTNE